MLFSETSPWQDQSSRMSSLNPTTSVTVHAWHLQSSKLGVNPHGGVPWLIPWDEGHVDQVTFHDFLEGLE